uniref:Calmodulin-lysine N-methyltransferase n=1 Tax=Saccoglossus kowalevskii TaxID=10224 RepID=A0ABM0LZF4_SACKO|nr:PREDICTED: calmodulin-lysine N-methyltransferase-like [Saccoglossus kowalevskii]
MVMSAARQRWRLLGQVLARKRESRPFRSEKHCASTRKFISFGLLSTTHLDTDDEFNSWYRYTCQDVTEFSVDIRQLTGPMGIEELIGFNNTGNVCVWPSEEVLTYHCLKHKNSFRNKTVCELGGGMTCLAGISIAAFCEAKEVLLTDGNEISVKNVHPIIKRNHSTFGSTKVTTRVIKWDKDNKYGDIAGYFDHIICADCLFFEQFQEDLLHVIYTLLKPEGLVTVFAPCRGNTLEQFCEMAIDGFVVERTDNYDQTVWEKHLQAKEKEHDIYIEDRHYPVMIILRKLKVTPHRLHVQAANQG